MLTRSLLPILAAPVLAFGCALSTVPTDAAIPDSPVADSATPLTCAEVQASCVGETATMVRGVASGLTGLEGARAQYGVRYLSVDGQGLDVARGVVTGWGVVRDGAFEACVCVPRAANSYPQVAAVVFAPGSTGTDARDVARATFSQRYAVLDRDEVSFFLNEPSSPVMAEVALAAMVERTAMVTLSGLSSLDGARVYAGIVGSERSLAAQVASGQISGGGLQLRWTMPGRAWPDEQVALIVDRSLDGRCGSGDLGAIITLNGRVEIAVGATDQPQAASLDAACAALSLETPRM